MSFLLNERKSFTSTCKIEGFYILFFRLLQSKLEDHVIRSIQFLFIYVLSSTASGQLHRQHDYKQQEWDNTGQNTHKKIDHLKLFIFKHELLKYLCIYKLHSPLKHVQLKGRC
jgi:hypothetical protein